jgi:hypothetical protein
MHTAKRARFADDDRDFEVNDNADAYKTYPMRYNNVNNNFLDAVLLYLFIGMLTTAAFLKICNMYLEQNLQSSSLFATLGIQEAEMRSLVQTLVETSEQPLVKKMLLSFLHMGASLILFFDVAGQLICNFLWILATCPYVGACLY